MNLMTPLRGNRDLDLGHAFSAVIAGEYGIDGHTRLKQVIKHDADYRKWPVDAVIRSLGGHAARPIGVTVVALQAPAAEFAELRRAHAQGQHHDPAFLDLLLAIMSAAPAPRTLPAMERARRGLFPLLLAARGTGRVQRPSSSAGPRRDGDEGVSIDRGAPVLHPEETPPLHGRAVELRRVIGGLLGALKNNVVIVGDEGVGKSALARGIVHARQGRDGNPAMLPEKLSWRTVRELDVTEINASRQGQQPIGELTRPIFAQIREEQCIVIIDDLRLVLGASTPNGGAGLVPALRVLLDDPNVPVLATCTESAWNGAVDKLVTFARSFTPVLIDEPPPHETQGIVRAMAEHLGSSHGLAIRDEAIIASVELGRRYLPRRRDPARSIELLDGACAVVLMARNTPPREIAVLDARVALLATEAKLLKGEIGERPERRLLEVEAELLEDRARRNALMRRWQEDRAIDSDLEQASNDWRKAGSKGAKAKARTRYDQLLSRRRASSAVGRQVDTDAVAAVVADRTGIEASRVRMTEAQRLLTMEVELHETIVGQDGPIEAIARAVRRSRVGLQQPRRPVAAFLMRGPTGVGKTETARALAKYLFNDPDAMVRIDMSEFAERMSLSRLTGSAPGLVGYEEGGVLTNAVLTRPGSVVLLDEVEKGHRDCMNLFLQVLDNGRLTDSKGRAVDFRQTVIILTTNLPTDEAIHSFFRPEFLNRLDGVLVFKTLDRGQLVAIARIAADVVLSRARDAHGIIVELADDVLEFVVDQVVDPRYGARPIHRGVTKYLVDPLATALLKNPLGPGAHLKVTVNAASKTLEISHGP
jgi:ATP-dependent Clp protease ATP-binding subunit ClpB